jgi:hypothetical protein
MRFFSLSFFYLFSFLRHSCHRILPGGNGGDCVNTEYYFNKKEIVVVLRRFENIIAPLT